MNKLDSLVIFALAILHEDKETTFLVWDNRQSGTHIKDKTGKGSSRCASLIRKVLKLTRYTVVVVIAVVLEYGLLSVERRPKLITVDFDVMHQNKRKYNSFVVSLKFSYLVFNERTLSRLMDTVFFVFWGKQ